MRSTSNHSLVKLYITQTHEWRTDASRNVPAEMISYLHFDTIKINETKHDIIVSSFPFPAFENHFYF